MRIVALESTFYHYFSTRRFSSGASFTLAGTPAIHAYEDNSDTQITAGLTLSADADSVTGFNRITIAATTANGFEAGKHYTLVIGAGTIDSVSVVGTVVGEFRVETATELAVRRLQESLYAAGHLVGATGNDTTHVHLSGIPAAISDDEINGELLLIWDVSASEAHFAVINDFANSGDLATVQNIYDGGALPFTPASGDYWFRLGPAPLTPTVKGRSLDVSSGGEAGMDLANVGSPTTTLNLSGTTISTSQAVASVSGAVGSVTGAVGSVTGNVGGNVTGSVGSVTGLTAADLEQIVDDLQNGGRLDLLIDAIKAKTDSLTFTQAGHVDANIQRINDVALTGDGQPSTEFSV